MLTWSISYSVINSLRFNTFVSYSTIVCRKNSWKCYVPAAYRLSQICQCYLDSNRKVHTVKGWKPLFRDGHREEYDPKKPPVSCEDGTDAVPHEELLSQLQNCNTVHDQIEKFTSVLSLSKKDVENRKEFIRSLTEAFNPYFPKFKVHLFGSSINGLGFKGCDADVCIQTIFEDEGYIPKVKEPPNLEAVRSGEVSADYVARLPPKMMLRFVRRIFRAHIPDIQNILFIKAKCPLLRFYHSKYDLFCDFSCENYSSLRNTKLMRLICHLDERVAPIIKFIRYWGKYGGFVGDIELFNSYAFSLLVVHFLQLRNPPVLPSIKELIDKSDYLVYGDINDDDLLLNDLKKFEQSKNSQGIDELLREYFFHFLMFDYLKIMVPLSSSVLPKDEFKPSVIKSEDDVFLFSTITVQDPFRLNFNVTESAKDTACLRYIKGLIEGCKVYQNQSLWNPLSENWGLGNLFYRTPFNEATNKGERKNWQQNKAYTIDLPLKTDAFLVKKILEECLLFDCEESPIINLDETPLPLLKLSCRVYYNTWIGRNLVRVNCPSSLSDWEKENWISSNISKNKMSGKQCFTFLCDFYENTRDNKLTLVLVFKKPEEYAYYLTVEILTIFLKEYLPSMCKKL